MKNKKFEKDLVKLFQKIQYNFSNLELINLALTHSSFSENKLLFNYERLEFLGDRVLGLSIASLMYKKFPDEKEGSLSKRYSDLVSKKTLTLVAKKIEIEKFIKTSNDFISRSKITDTMLSDVVEALIGAVFLDSDFNRVKQTIEILWAPFIKEQLIPPTNPKSYLQEWCLKSKKKLPEYNLIEKKGPDHKPTFFIELKIKNFIKVCSEGSSKQEAEINAAIKLLKKIKK